MRLRSSCFLMVALTIAGSDLACAQDADCNVHRGEFVNGGQSQGKMVVVTAAGESPSRPCSCKGP